MDPECPAIWPDTITQPTAVGGIEVGEAASSKQGDVPSSDPKLEKS
jgi:hypothetical protein